MLVASEPHRAQDPFVITVYFEYFFDIYRLRNLSWIRLYDTTKMNRDHQRNSSAVRDRSAVEDLNR